MYNFLKKSQTVESANCVLTLHFLQFTSKFVDIFKSFLLMEDSDMATLSLLVQLLWLFIPQVCSRPFFFADSRDREDLQY